MLKIPDKITRYIHWTWWCNSPVGIRVPGRPSYGVKINETGGIHSSSHTRGVIMLLLQID